MKNLLCLVCLLTATCIPESGAHIYNEVCYKDLGCFSNAPPYSDPNGLPEPLPESPYKINTTYLLYTRKSDQPQSLNASHPNDALIKLTNYKPGVPVKIIAHGARGKNEETPWLKDMADALLKHADYNVIIVDWSGGSSVLSGLSFPFAQAAANGRVVGAQIAQLVAYLIKFGNVTQKDFHLIGHSIGAHIVGGVGRITQAIRRITGLDPCGPSYTGRGPEVELDRTDAQFVDVIHTNMAETVILGIGTTDLCGHVDFFPNGGRMQPGCDLITSVAAGGIQALGDVPTCSHSRAHQYFIQSINSTTCQFPSFPCASETDFKEGRCQSCGDVGCANMGFPADQYIVPEGQTTVKFFLKTGATTPYCNNSATNNGFFARLRRYFSNLG